MYASFSKSQVKSYNILQIVANSLIMKDKTFSSILKEKRSALKLNQTDMAELLGMKLRMYSDYETGKYDDTKGDIRREFYLQKLANISDDKVILPIKQGNIVFVPLHAYGGFLGGYRDTIFIESLEHFRLPGVMGEHYAFEIGGMSMYKAGDERSAAPGDIAISRPVEELKHLLKGKGYILQTIDGIIYKIFDTIKGEKAHFLSLNTDYDGCELALREIKKAYFVNFILKKTT